MCLPTRNQTSESNYKPDKPESKEPQIGDQEAGRTHLGNGEWIDDESEKKYITENGVIIPQRRKSILSVLLNPFVQMAGFNSIENM